MAETPSSGAGDWDLTGYFPEFGGTVYRDFWSELAGDIEAMARDLAAAPALTVAEVEGWSERLVRLEQMTVRMRHLLGYLGCMGAADAVDQAIQRENARAWALDAELQKLYVRVRAVLRDSEDGAFESLGVHAALDGAAYFLARTRRRAQWSMPPELETLATDLGVNGLQAWGRLYDQVSGKLEFDLAAGGETRRLPVAMTRTFLEDGDADVRRAALAGANTAWAGAADVTAACLNAIAGTRLELYRRRGVEHFLDPAVFDAGITRKTLDVMFETVRARAELPRRYLRRKAALLGRERIGFQDLMAPLPIAGQERIPWERGRASILEAFGSFYPDLQAFAARAFEQRWLDYTPRPGKRPGGFCSSSKWLQESRIFCTYNGALGDVVTVAHELGHAFHSHLLRPARPWASGYPMTLAETASTFAQNLVVDALLDRPESSPEQTASMLDGRMQDASAFLLNIPMRFAFEKAVYEERAGGELSVDRLCELMREAQLDVYGDALDPDQLDPWFWASKLHFYITGISFYNFPYTFGYLFSTGIFARARQEGADYLPRYEDLLRRTGSDSAEGVARHALGVDLEAPDFWNASLDLIESDLERFESAVEGL